MKLKEKKYNLFYAVIAVLIGLNTFFIYKYNAANDIITNLEAENGKLKSNFFSEKVECYICNSTTSSSYHKAENCPALSNCKSGIKGVSIFEAESKGKVKCKRCF